jgi:hypothetical protein
MFCYGWVLEFQDAVHNRVLKLPDSDHREFMIIHFETISEMKFDD